MSEQLKTLSVACAEQEEDLVLLHYGDLAGAEFDKLQRHLDGCAGCRNFLQDLGKLLPLTRKADDPPPSFWTDYNRELRQKLDGATGGAAWRQRLAAIFERRPVPMFATAAIVALTLTFTFGEGLWRTNDPAPEQVVLLEALPVAENLEFFGSMDVLDDLDLLEAMASQGGGA